jgi:hypothetical protein
MYRKSIALAFAALTLTACGGDDSSSNETEGPVVNETVGQTAPPMLFQSVDELIETVCDPGSVEKSDDPHDTRCTIDGHEALVTDWTTFGGPPEASATHIPLDLSYGVKAPPAAIKVANERISAGS